METTQSTTLPLVLLQLIGPDANFYKIINQLGYNVTIMYLL